MATEMKVEHVFSQWGLALGLYLEPAIDQEHTIRDLDALEDRLAELGAGNSRIDALLATCAAARRGAGLPPR